MRSLLAWGIIAHLFCNALFSIFLLCVAGSNYPGGMAIARLHRLERNSADSVYVHIDAFSAQTGVSRFTQINSSWIYSKEENLTESEMLKFSHLLIGAKSKYSATIKAFSKSHTILDSVDGFWEISVNYNSLRPIKIKTKPMIFILKKSKVVLNEMNDLSNSKAFELNSKVNISQKIQLLKEKAKEKESLEVKHYK